jgi:hypothetical protein
MNKLGQKSAFPMVNSDGFPGKFELLYDENEPQNYSIGMSKRFYAACESIKSEYCKVDNLTDKDMEPNANGYYIRLDDGNFVIPQSYTPPEEMIKYSVITTELQRYIRFAYKLADELLKQENI